MLKTLFVIVMFIPSCALAQQSQQTPLEQALGQKLMSEINNGVSCNTRLIEVLKQLDEMKAKAKEPDK